MAGVLIILCLCRNGCHLARVSHVPSASPRGLGGGGILHGPLCFAIGGSPLEGANSSRKGVQEDPLSLRRINVYLRLPGSR